MLRKVKLYTETLMQRSQRNPWEHLEGRLRNQSLSWSCCTPGGPPRPLPALLPLLSSQVHAVLPKKFYKCTKCSFPGVSNWTAYFYLLKTTWCTSVSSLLSPATKVPSVSTLPGWDRLLEGGKHGREELKKLLNKYTFPLCILYLYFKCLLYLYFISFP